MESTRINPCRFCLERCIGHQMCEPRLDYEAWSACCSESQVEWKMQEERNEYNFMDIEDYAEEHVDIPLGGIPSKQVFFRDLSLREAQVVIGLMTGYTAEQIRNALEISRDNYNHIMMRLRRKAQ